MARFITWEDRLVIEKMLRAKYPVAAIAKVINKNRSNLYAEIKKGQIEIWGEWEYSAQKAQQITDFRKSSHGPNLKIGSNHQAAKSIEALIHQGFSPYAASVILKENGIISISKNTIYEYIYSGVLDLSTKNLIQGKRKQKASPRSRKNKIIFGNSIETRPHEVLLRRSLGDWEMDTVQPSHNKKSCFLVLTERHSRYEIVAKLANKESSTMLTALRKIVKKHHKLIKTITCDNGSEFAKAAKIEEESNIKVYFAHPYSAYERGSNENNNRFIRRFYPKGTDFDNVTDSDLIKVQNFINNYPRKIFGGKTAQQVFDEAVRAGNISKY